MGIEPTSSAWKAEVLPLNYARRIPALISFDYLPQLLAGAAIFVYHQHQIGTILFKMVEGVGFEPTKA